MADITNAQKARLLNGGSPMVAGVGGTATASDPTIVSIAQSNSTVYVMGHLPGYRPRP